MQFSKAIYNNSIISHPGFSFLGFFFLIYESLGQLTHATKGHFDKQVHFFYHL